MLVCATKFTWLGNRCFLITRSPAGALQRMPGVELLSNPGGIIYDDQHHDQVQHERVAYLLPHKLFTISNTYCI
jgi:hypothetical protein